VDRIGQKRGHQESIGLSGTEPSYRTTGRKLSPAMVTFLTRLICIVVLILLIAMAVAAIWLAH
jgi:hypothetical protein